MRERKSQELQNRNVECNVLKFFFQFNSGEIKITTRKSTHILEKIEKKIEEVYTVLTNLESNKLIINAE